MTTGKFLAVLCLIVAFAAGTAAAQPYPFNAAGVAMGHWHLNSDDEAANRKILLAMGGVPTTAASAETVTFPGIVVRLKPAENPVVPSAGGSIGTVIDHLAFTVPEVRASVAAWRAAGVPVSIGDNGHLDRAIIMTADGMKIEILEDKNQKIPIRAAHVHFAVPRSEIPRMQDWYAKVFGAVTERRGRDAASTVAGMGLRFSDTGRPTVTNKGRVLDHIGFDVQHLESFIARIAAMGVKLDRPYAKGRVSGLGFAFLTDPWGTYIELNEAPGK